MDVMQVIWSTTGCKQQRQSDEDCEDLYIQLENVLASVRHVKANAASDVHSGARGTECIILDNGAEVSIFNNKRLFTNLRECEPICIDGVNKKSEGVHVATIGTTAFGEAYYSSAVMGNILSFGESVDNLHRVSYDAAEDAFHIQVAERGGVYVFSRRGQSKLYTCNLSDSKRVLVDTVRENMSKYTKREVKRAFEAKELQRRLGIATAGQLIKLLAAGKIRNTDIQVQDVVRSVEIWGKDLANLKGKTTAKKAPGAQFDSDSTDKVIKGVMQRDQVMHIDIMFVESSMYMVTVFTPSGYSEIKKLKAKGHAEMLRVINACRSYMTRAGFNITSIKCDGEAAIDTDLLRGNLDVDLDITGGESVPIVERKIRTIKERFRGTKSTLPYNMTEQLEDWLVQHTIYFLNFTPTSDSMDNRSAREKVKGKLINAKTDLKHGFGDYVQIGDQETSNSMDERTRGAIALMPTGNSEGSWFYLVLKTWKAIKRNHAECLPMPDAVIDYINAKAAEQNAKRKTVRVGDTIKMGLYRPGSEDLGEAEAEPEADDIAEAAVYLPEDFIPDRSAEEVVGADDLIDEDLQAEDTFNTTLE